MNESNASLETSQPNNQSNSQTDNNRAAPSKPANNQQAQPDKPRTLADLFADPKDETSTEINLDESTPDDPDAPVDSIDRLMKRHKLSAEQAYGIKIPMPNGAEALTIGQLKDKVSDLVDFELRETQFDERRIRQEGEILKSHHELKGILELLPKEAKSPEFLAKVRARQDEVTRAERFKTLEHIPEWKDEKKRTNDFDGIMKMLSDYGFDENFFGTVIDHRAMKFLRDTYLMRSRIQRALANVRDPKQIGGRPSGKPGKPANKPNGNAAKPRGVQTQDDRLRTWFQSKE